MQINFRNEDYLEGVAGPKLTTFLNINYFRKIVRSTYLLGTKLSIVVLGIVS